MIDAHQLAAQYKSALLEDVIPFWSRHSLDTEHGGYFTCLARDGSVYDSDKFIWLQSRQVWTYAMLYNQVEKREEWLVTALHGMDFLLKHGMDENGDWYFSLTRTGQPLVQPYNIFSDCFAAMALGQLAIATQIQRYADLAVKTYRNILIRASNPKGIYNKLVPGTRPVINFALPMILCNLTLELQDMLPDPEIEATLRHGVHQVMELFLDKERMLIYENCAPDGSHIDCFEGRLLNPGHGIEAMWFIMDIADRWQDESLRVRAIDVTLSILDFAWDETYGGLYYFMDADGNPPQQLEWDQKLWWVHLEALVALSTAYRISGQSVVLDWYERVHDYAWSHFADPEYGEWYGYISRRGDVLMPLKGGKWKGCFHVPRALHRCWQEFERITNDTAR